MPDINFHADFDRALKSIYDLKSLRLTKLLLTQNEVLKEKIRLELNQLDEEKQLLYSLNHVDILLFIQRINESYL